MAVRGAPAQPLQALAAYLGGFAMLAPSADALANHLAYLQPDLSTPALRARTQAMFLAHEEAVQSLVRDAVLAGELRPVDARALARTLLAVTQGALILWGVHRNGGVRQALRREVQAVLAPWRTAR